MRHLLIVLILVAPVAWAANVEREGQTGIGSHGIVLCYGMACRADTFMWGTCRYPGLGENVTLAPKR